MKNVKKPVLIILLIILLIATQLESRLLSNFAISLVFLVGFELGRMEGLLQARADGNRIHTNRHTQ